MFKSSIGEWFRDEREKLRPMSRQKRLEHLWTYYRFHALAIIGAIAILVLLIYGQMIANQDVLISGIFINTDTSKEGYEYLSDGYWSSCGGDRHTRADIIETMVIRYSRENPDQDSITMMTSIDAMISARTLDYMLLDASALSYYGPLENCADLSKVLPKEFYDGLSDRIVTVHGIESGGEYPAAIDVTGSDFGQRFGLTADPSYLVVAANAKDMDKVAAFLEYFFN